MFKIVFFAAALCLVLSVACGDAESEDSVFTPTAVASVAATSSPTMTPVAISIMQPPVGPQTCEELEEDLEPSLGPTSEIIYCDDEAQVGVVFHSKSKTWVVYPLATPTIEDWRAKQATSISVLEELGAEPCSSYWTIVDPLKPELQPGDMDPYGCQK